MKRKKCMIIIIILTMALFLYGCIDNNESITTTESYIIDYNDNTQKKDNSYYAFFVCPKISKILNSHPHPLLHKNIFLQVALIFRLVFDTLSFPVCIYYGDNMFRAIN